MGYGQVLYVEANRSIILCFFLEECLGVLAGRAILRRVFTFMNIATIAAFPANRFFFFENLIFFKVAQ